MVLSVLSVTNKNIILKKPEKIKDRGKIYFLGSFNRNTIINIYCLEMLLTKQ